MDVYKKIQLAIEEHAIHNYIEFDNEHSLDESIEAYLQDSFDIIMQSLQEDEEEIIQEAKKHILGLIVTTSSVKELLEKIQNDKN